MYVGNIHEAIILYNIIYARYTHVKVVSVYLLYIHTMAQTYSIQAHMCSFSGYCSFSEAEHPCISIYKNEC